MKFGGLFYNELRQQKGIHFSQKSHVDDPTLDPDELHFRLTHLGEITKKENDAFFKWFNDYQKQLDYRVVQECWVQIRSSSPTFGVSGSEPKDKHIYKLSRLITQEWLKDFKTNRMYYDMYIIFSRTLFYLYKTYIFDNLLKEWPTIEVLQGLLMINSEDQLEILED